MSNILEFPGVSTSCTASTTRELDRDSLRAAAWSNFYTAERRDGASPDIAAQRADFFITKRFESLVDELREIMGN